MARMGRPPAEDPKVIPVKVRVGKQTDADIEYCSMVLGKSRSEILRMGVKLVKEQIKQKK